MPIVPTHARSRSCFQPHITAACVPPALLALLRRNTISPDKLIRKKTHSWSWQRCAKWRGVSVKVATGNGQQHTHTHTMKTCKHTCVSAGSDMRFIYSHTTRITVTHKNNTNYAEGQICIRFAELNTHHIEIRKRQKNNINAYE